MEEVVNMVFNIKRYCTNVQSRCIAFENDNGIERGCNENFSGLWQ